VLVAVVLTRQPQGKRLHNSGPGDTIHPIAGEPGQETVESQEALA